MAQEAPIQNGQGQGVMARYRPQRSWRPTLSLVPATVEATGNYRALDTGPVRGHRTPIMWPPLVMRSPR